MAKIIRRDKMVPQGGSYEERVARYRNRAEELRVITDDWASLQAKEVLLRLAMTYDNAARQIEQIVEARAVVIAERES